MLVSEIILKEGGTTKHCNTLPSSSIIGSFVVLGRLVVVEDWVVVSGEGVVTSSVACDSVVVSLWGRVISLMGWSSLDVLSDSKTKFNFDLDK